MSEGNNKIQYYLDEDNLFLLLKLLDYLKMKKGKLTFNKIKVEKYKQATVSKIFYDILILNRQGLLKIEGLKFNILGASKNDCKIFKALLSSIRAYPAFEMSLAMKRTINDNFNLHDLEIILSHKYSDQIFNLIDFDIKISQKFKQQFIKRIKEYLKLFADGKLESSTENYFRIELQKESIEEKIDEISKETGSALVLKSSNFSSKFRFFESMLLTEKEGKLAIKNISSEETNKNSFSYIIYCELKEKCYFRPYCKIKNDIGFLKFSQDGEAIKIGGIDSRHFKLLELLLKRIGIARSINSAFEYIETDKDNKESGINDPYLKPAEQIRILENAKKELQKGNKMKGRIKIKIDKMRKTIRAEYRNEGD